MIPDFSFKAGERVHLWQYANADRLNAIIDNELAFHKKNVTDFISNWYNDVFNLKTANSFGIEIWGKILGVRRPSTLQQNFVIDTNSSIKFLNIDTGTWHTIFVVGQSPNVSIAVETNPPNPSPTPVQISDEAYRRCLLAKLFLLHSNGSIIDINRYLYKLFGGRQVTIVDNYDMTMRIDFNYSPTETELSIITSKDFSPRPAGVELQYSISSISKNTFGFEGQELSTWIDGRETTTEVPDGYGTFIN